MKARITAIVAALLALPCAALAAWWLWQDKMLPALVALAAAHFFIAAAHCFHPLP